MIFADTGALYAATVPTDPDHSKAVEWLHQNVNLLLVTDYIIDEVLTLLQAKGERNRALRLGHLLFAEEFCRIHFLETADISQSWELFCAYDDKGWSFTDCSSKVVMERLDITTAFAFDDHFRQFGTVTVVPQL